MTENVKCPTCGKSTPNATFCQYCGRSLYRCGACGAKMVKYAIFCPECGTSVPPERRKSVTLERTSWAWWLLPLLFSLIVGFAWVGGLIAWALNRFRDPAKATGLLWFGISLTVIEVVVVVILSR